MEKYRFIILGAGVSGLALAARLRQLGEESFVVLEKESAAGGLCRSALVDGSPLDTGGGHFLDVRNEAVNNFIFTYLPSGEWNRFERITKIQLGKSEIDYPYEANIWQLPVDEQVEHLISIFNAGCNRGAPRPGRFSDWIPWKVGGKIADGHLLPYCRKVYGADLDELSTEWLHKLPEVSLRDTLKSCLLRRPFAELPAHASFLYPKRHGYGEFCARLARTLEGKLRLATPVTGLDFERRTVNGLYQAEVIVNTIPWTEMGDFPALPGEVRAAIRRLKYASIDIDYEPEKRETAAHWTYFPDLSLPYHRILHRHNFMAEGTRGHWTETGTARVTEGQRARRRDYFHNRYAYPLYTLGRAEALRSIAAWAGARGVHGLGRWGEWDCLNSDAAIGKALSLGQKLARGTL
ncbi:MAG TPA: FAD-dependent oxidoreductase [Elusimicrobiales bacterium]|nr:FAD-dependent oxidoreductase [Elusimicrobiales bacterium]